jgi:rhamnosyl/mannosyltransferase
MERVIEILCRASAGLVQTEVLVANTTRQTTTEDVALGTGDAHRVHVTRVGTVGAVGSVHLAPAFPSHLRRAHPDLIVLHEPNPWALLSYAIARPRAPLVIWYHSDVVRPALQYALFYAPFARFVYGRAERIVVSSPALAQHATVLEPYRDRIRVVPFAINPADWVATAADRELVAKAQSEFDAPFVFFAGRHVPYKGVDVLLRALERLRVHAVIAGDGPRRLEWERMAAGLGLMPRVRFVGEVPAHRLRTLMQACAALVLPSVTRAEAFGYVQLEAMACGKPVVSTDVPSGVSWVNQHERTGLVVRAGDPVALAGAIQALVDDSALRARLGEAARQRVEREFSMTRLRDRMRDLYEDTGILEAQRAAC